ncbi:jg1393, partial [Pararge aegeria aegeria]
LPYQSVYRDRRDAEQPRVQPATLHMRRLRTPCWARCSVEKPNEAKLIPLQQRRQWPSSRASLPPTLCD